VINAAVISSRGQVCGVSVSCGRGAPWWVRCGCATATVAIVRVAYRCRRRSDTSPPCVSAPSHSVRVTRLSVMPCLGCFWLAQLVAVAPSEVDSLKAGCATFICTLVCTPSCILLGTNIRTFLVLCLIWCTAFRLLRVEAACHTSLQQHTQACASSHHRQAMLHRAVVGARPFAPASSYSHARAHMHTLMHTHMYTHMRAHLHTRIPTLMHALTYTPMQACTLLCILICTLLCPGLGGTRAEATGGDAHARDHECT
jgi:hypothetical protein